MKKFALLIFVFILYVVSADIAFAKKEKGLDKNDVSVQLLQNIVDTGREVRANDEPVQKADIAEDTARINELKQKYYEENAVILKYGKK